MTRLALAATTSLLLASAAAAGGITVSFPTLTYPTSPDVTVTKDCLITDATSQTCVDSE